MYKEIIVEEKCIKRKLQHQVLGQPCLISTQRLKKASWRKRVKVRYRHKNILGEERYDGILFR